MNVRLIAPLSFIAVLVACATRDTVADSTRLAQARADSIRALGPAGWTDDELIAYATITSLTLAGDDATVQRRSGSRAVKAFTETVASQHRHLLRVADSLSRRSTPAQPPSVSAALVQAHEAEMRRLQKAPDFDRAYVKQVRTTLTEVEDHLRRASVTDRGTGAVRLLNQAHASIGRQLRTASELQRALEGPGTRTPPASKATPR